MPGNIATSSASAALIPSGTSVTGSTIWGNTVIGNAYFYVGTSQYHSLHDLEIEAHHLEKHNKYNLAKRLEGLRIQIAIDVLILPLELKRRIKIDLEDISHKISYIEKMLNIVESSKHEDIIIAQIVYPRLNEIFELIGSLFEYINCDENYPIFASEKASSTGKDTYEVKKTENQLVICSQDNKGDILRSYFMFEHVKNYIIASSQKEESEDVDVSYFMTLDGKTTLKNIQKFYAKSILIELETWVEAVNDEFCEKIKVSEKGEHHTILKAAQDINSQALAHDRLKAVLGHMQQLFQAQYPHHKPNCFICYKWIKENYQIDDQITEFLDFIKSHLKLAGIATYLDTESDLNPESFFTLSSSSDYLILVGTSSSFSKYKDNFHAFYEKLIRIKEFKYHDFLLSPRVSTLVLDGSKFSFEQNYKLYMENSFGNVSYITYLKNLLRVLYNVSKNDVEYENLWINATDIQEKQYEMLSNKEIKQSLFQEILPQNTSEDESFMYVWNENEINFNIEESKLSTIQSEASGDLIMLDMLEQEKKSYNELLQIISDYRNDGVIDLNNMKKLLNKLINSKSSLLIGIRGLLDNENLKHENRQNKTLLHIAVEENNKEMVLILLKLTKKMLIIQDDLGNTPLHYSVIFDFGEITSLLISAGADENIPNREHNTPLLLAAQCGSLRSIKAFSIKSRIDFSLALYEAMKARRIEVIQEILIFSSIHDINKILKFESFETTYLCHACELGYPEIVNILLKIPGIDINRPKVFNSKVTLKLSPLHLSIKKNHASIIEQLLNVEHVNIDIYTFYLAILYDNQDLLKKLLCNRGRNLNEVISSEQDLKNQNDRILVAACREGKVEMVKILLRHLQQFKVDINANGKEGLSPLFVACKNGHIEIVKILLLCKNIIITVNKTPISHFALQNKQYKIIELLFDDDIKFDINMTDGKGATLLHLVCQSGNDELFDKLFLTKEELLFLPDSNDRYPIFYLIENDNLDMFIKLFNCNPDQKIILDNKDSSVFIISYFAIQYKALKIYNWVLNNLILKISSAEREKFYLSLLSRIIHDKPIKNNLTDMLKLLKNQIYTDNDLSKNIKDKVCVVASYYAIDCEKSDVGLILLNKDNSEINCTFEKENCTLIYHACNKLNRELFNALLSFDYIDVNLGYFNKANNIPLVFKLMSEKLNDESQLKLLKHPKLDLRRCKSVVDKRGIIQKTSILFQAIQDDDSNFIGLLFQAMKELNTDIAEYFPTNHLFYAALMIKDKVSIDKFCKKLDRNSNVDFNDENNILIISMRKKNFYIITYLLKWYDFDSIPAENRFTLSSILERSSGEVRKLFTPELMQKIDAPEIIMEKGKSMIDEYEKGIYFFKKNDNLTSLNVARKVIRETNLLLQVSIDKKEFLKNFLRKIENNESDLSRFIEMKFGELETCKNQNDIYEVLNCLPGSEDEFLSLLSSLILPEFGWTGLGAAKNCGKTTTFKLLLKLHKALNDKLGQTKERRNSLSPS